jgi:hypothetical protein
MQCLSRALGRVTTALHRRSIAGKYSHAGLAQRHNQPPTAPSNIPPTPRRTHIAVNGDALPLVRPYVLVVVKARRNGAVSW